MERAKFEPFGEEIKLPESAEVGASSSGSLLWIGSGLFWILAGTIVIARAIYFDPSVFDRLNHIVTLWHGVPNG
jgi:hypothetical protein